MSQLVDLLGRYHTYLRVSVTDRCNLRCTYCMPAGASCTGATDHLLAQNEIVRICRLFAALGVDKIRLTGGEPLVRRDIVELARGLAALPGIAELGVTTNGVLLAPLAAKLVAAGVNRINISLDTLNRARFKQIALRDRLDEVLAGVEAALVAGFKSIRLNVVVIPGVNEDELFDFVEFVRWRQVCIRFIEYMPVGRQWNNPGACIPTARLIERLSERHHLAAHAGTGGTNSVAREFRLEGFQGTVGFISTVSGSFCGGCNRLRLSANGTLKTCLHYPAELNLREALRGGAGDAELAQLISAALRSKRPGRPGGAPVPDEVAACMERRSMFQLGG
jgi:cyclic pyranopterin phosphate synthase